MIVVFLLFFTNGIQAQTETQSIKLMNALIEADCNNSNGIVNSVEDDNFAGQGNISLLMYGSLNGCTEVVKALLDKGAKIDGQGDDGWTALICASLNGHLEVVKLLLEKGANTELKTIEGTKVLDYAKNADIEALLTTYTKK
jgi:ankyrin repeat protein